MKNVVLTSSDFLDESRHAMIDHRNHELMKKIQRYEKGEKGNLTSAFFTCIPDWLEYCVKLGEYFNQSVNQLVNLRGSCLIPIVTL